MNTPTTRITSVHTRARRLSRHLFTVSCCVAAGSIAASTFAAPISESSRPQPKGEPKPVTILVMNHAGVGSMFVDPKDQNLKKALAMLPARLKELPREFPDMDNVPMPLVDLVLSMVSRPARMAVTFDPNGGNNGAFGFGLVASIGPADEKQTSQIHGGIGALVQMAANKMGDDAPGSKPSAAFKGMAEIQVPIANIVRYGPRKAPDGWRYELHLGAAQDPDTTFLSLPAPMAKGMTPVFSGRFDFSGLDAVATQYRPLIEGSGREAEEGLKELERIGILGPDAIKYSWQAGYTDTEQVGYTVIEGVRKHAKDIGMSTASLTDAHLAMIPSDATVAFMQTFDFSKGLQAIQTQIQNDPQIADGINQFEAATGVDPFEDILLNLGDTVGMYMSDSTGGSLASMVFFVSLSDRPRFEAAHDKLLGFASGMISANHDINGHLRMRSWNEADSKLFSLTFPGLPVPLEVSYALVDNWLVAGFTPQSALAAVRQIKGKGDKGLRSNPGFAAAIPAGQELSGFKFIDSPKLMRDGYQYVAMMGSMVANAVRSPFDEKREPGLVVPTFAELKAGARPMVSFGYWKGQDHVTESHADRSMLVNITGIMGAASPVIPLVAATIAAAAPQMQRQMGGGGPFGDDFEDEFEGGLDDILIQRTSPRPPSLPK